MSDLVEVIATFLRRTKLPIEQAFEEVNRRWPEVRGDQLERAAKIATHELLADAWNIRAVAQLWEASDAARRSRANDDRGSG